MKFKKYIPPTIKDLIATSMPYRFYQGRLATMRNFPIAFNIELTTKCNLKCRMCPRAQMIQMKNLHVGDMDFDLFKQIIDDISQSGIITKWSSFTLSGLGEPLMYDRLPDAIAYTKGKCPRTSVTIDTNGTLLDEAWARKLCQVLTENDRILISLNAGSRESYMWLMRSDKYDLVVDNIKNLLRLRETKQKNQRPQISIQLLATKGTKHEVKQFKTMWKPYTDPTVICFIKSFIGSRYLNNSELRVEEPPRRYPCLSLWLAIAIDKSGNVFPCCYSRREGPNPGLFLGNVRQSSIKEIYLVGAKSLRERHLKDDYRSLPVCGICETYAAYPNIWFRNRLISERWW